MFSKKHTFFVFKKRNLLIAIFAVFAVALFVTLCLTVPSSTTPNLAPTIVIDAGHGGIDAGASGKTTGVLESDLNLAYAKTLKEICQELGYNVVMTRATSEGLYSPVASNKKRSEMEKRKAIIDQSDADLVISVHMNSFPLSSSSGAQVFYAKGNAQGQQLATLVQSSIKQSFSNARKTASVGDYFILNCTDKPAILIEFGFLSNPQEEVNLQNDEYRHNICLSVLAGVMSYFK